MGVSGYPGNRPSKKAGKVESGIDGTFEQSKANEGVPTKNQEGTEAASGVLTKRIGKGKKNKAEKSQKNTRDQKF